MKKLLVILLAALVLLALAGCGKTAGPEETPEPPEEELVYEPLPETALPLEERLRGDWYAGYQGLMLTLTLAEDGSYAFRCPGQEDQQGAWVLDEGMVILDGEEDEVLLPVGDVLRWSAANLLFTREAPEVYVPGEVRTDAQPDDLNGYWKSRFVVLGDGAILASALGENTDLYIEGTHVALGGPLFGDIIVDMELRNGTLTYEKEDVSVSLALQSDGFLRLNVGGEEPITIYLLPAVPGWEELEPWEVEVTEEPTG